MDANDRVNSNTLSVKEFFSLRGCKCTREEQHVFTILKERCNYLEFTHDCEDRVVCLFVGENRVSGGAFETRGTQEVCVFDTAVDFNSDVEETQQYDMFSPFTRFLKEGN